MSSHLNCDASLQHALALAGKGDPVVRGQLYENWELCIADDASTDAHVREILNRYAAKNPRIKVHYRTENGHISACSNDALALATGDYVGLLDHDDELHETALLHVALEANRYPEAGIIFSDEDKIDPLGQRKEPYFKSDFSDELFLSRTSSIILACTRENLFRLLEGFAQASRAARIGIWL